MSEQERIEKPAETVVVEAERPAQSPVAGALLQRKIARRLLQRRINESTDPSIEDKNAQIDARKEQDGMQKKFGGAGAQYVFNVSGGHQVLVFLPPGDIKGPAVDVFVFFHGNGGDYESKGDNTAKNAGFQAAITASGKIGLAPVGGANADWEKWSAGDFKAMVDEAMTQLSGMTQSNPPLKAGTVSLAGHSAGGKALGQAAIDLDVPEVTLQDAGYGMFKGVVSASYTNSWDLLDRWFLAGSAPKTLRVISHDSAGSGGVDASTRYAAENKDHGFNETALATSMARLVSSGVLPAALTIARLPGDGTARAGSGGGMKLEYKVTATKPDGTLQGTLYVFHLATTHTGVRNETMTAAAQGGGDDFGVKRKIQRHASDDNNGIAANASSAVEAAAGSTGSALPSQLRGQFEQSLGTDLGDVRVHTGAASQAAAESVSARAYTTGKDVHFNRGEYDPSSKSGQELIAHEVAHTAQQSAGAAGPQHKLEVSEPGDASEVEADRAAEAMVSGGQATMSGSGGIARKTIQRAVGWGDATTGGHNAGPEDVGTMKRIPIDGLSSITIATDNDQRAAPAGNDPKKVEGIQGRAVVCFPGGLDPKAVEVLLFLHGHNIGYRQQGKNVDPAFPELKAGDVQDVSVDRIEQQIQASGRPMIGMLPQGTSVSNFNPAKGAGEGFDSNAFINEVLDRLVTEKLFVARPVVKGVVLSAHSGGSHGMAEMLADDAGQGYGTGKAPSKFTVNEVILFDAINRAAETTAVKAWLDKQLGRDSTALQGMKGNTAAQTAYLTTSMRFRLFFTPGYTGSLEVQDKLNTWFDGAKSAALKAAGDKAVVARWHDNYRAEITTAMTTAKAPGVPHNQEVGTGQLQDELQKLPPVQAPPYTTAASDTSFSVDRDVHTQPDDTTPVVGTIPAGTTVHIAGQPADPQFKAVEWKDADGNAIVGYVRIEIDIDVTD